MIASAAYFNRKTMLFINYINDLERDVKDEF